MPSSVKTKQCINKALKPTLVHLYQFHHCYHHTHISRSCIYKRSSTSHPRNLRYVTQLWSNAVYFFLWCGLTFDYCFFDNLSVGHKSKQTFQRQHTACSSKNKIQKNFICLLKQIHFYLNEVVFIWIKCPLILNMKQNVSKIIAFKMLKHLLWCFQMLQKNNKRWHCS